MKNGQDFSLSCQNDKNKHLLKTEALFERVQRMAKIGTWTHDISNDRLEWSEEVYRIFEVSPEQFDGAYEFFLAAVHPEDRMAVNASYISSLERQTPYGIEYRLLMPDGRVKYVREECETRFSDAGEPILSLGTVQDITALKILQEENYTHQQLLLQQSKMAQMGSMIDTIAHQWKQPLYQINSILPMLEQHLINGTLSPEILEEHLDTIEMLTNHMSQTVDSFRNFFHPQKQRERFNVAEAIREVFKLMGGEFERKGITLELATMQPCMAEGSKKEFIQAILSIFNNAKECFSHRAVEQPKLWVSIACIAEEITITIRDNAGGIPEAYVNKIFNLYFTTKRQDRPWALYRQTADRKRHVRHNHGRKLGERRLFHHLPPLVGVIYGHIHPQPLYPLCRRQRDSP